MFDNATLLGLLSALHVLLLLTVIPVILVKKRDSTVAVAWVLFVLETPVLGALLFWAFGYNYVQRRVRRKRQHRRAFREQHPPTRREATRGAEDAHDLQLHPLVEVARAVDAFPVSGGNTVRPYAETTDAFEALLDAVRQARHHVHLEFYIFRGDDTGQRLVAALIEKLREGVEVRLLTDAVGSLFLAGRLLAELDAAGGKTATFLPVNPLRSWIQVNLRNHRKMVVIDGVTGFLGGMNIGDEYLGKDPEFGYWRDLFVRIDGPAVAGLQRVFAEDWDFAAGEALDGDRYFPDACGAGDVPAQVVEAGPDQEYNSIREVYFAAILEAKKRLWIASPYFVPDNGLLDALRLARHRGVDVRLLCLLRPDHRLSFYASRYYWGDMLSFGAKVYQYKRGMMHAKLVLVDDDWAMVGSANLDNRSLHLNFEVCCLVYSAAVVEELAAAYLRDLEASLPLDAWAFANRPFVVRLLENACRLLSPVL